MIDLKKYIADIADFPSEWIIFKDISPLLANPQAFQETINLLVNNIADCDVIVWLDARGFIFAGALAAQLSKPLVLVRKSWKLPWDTINVDYDLEYGSNTFEIQKNAIKSGDKVAVIDDLLATGWTALAACELIETLGWSILSVEFIIELWFLPWRKKLKNYTINSLLTY